MIHKPEYVLNAFVLTSGEVFLAPSRHHDTKRAAARAHVVMRASNETIRSAYRVNVYLKPRKRRPARYGGFLE